MRNLIFQKWEFRLGESAIFGVCRAELRSRWSYVGTKLAYVGLSLDLYWLKLATVGRKVAYVGPCWAYVGRSRASEASDARRDAAKMGQDGAYVSTKMGPIWADGNLGRPRWAQDGLR